MSSKTLLDQRYGAGQAPTQVASNSVIDLLLNHRSVRTYKPDPLPDGALAGIIAAAQSAATSSNLQTWSVVEVTEKADREVCAVMAGNQKHIVDCPIFLLFVADLARLTMIARREGMPHAGNDTFEMFAVAMIDAALAAQNAVIAAESMGLSTVYIGGMRNKPEEVARLINLPQGAMVCFGLCIGYAAEGGEGTIKPRLPQAAVWHKDRYDLPSQHGGIEASNRSMAAFYTAQKMDVKGTWAQHSSRRVSGPESLSGRHLLMQALRRMGFFRAE
jgi:nitroreductase